MPAPSAAALQAELQTDPTSQGYASLITSGDRSGLAAKINAVQQTITIRRPDIAPSELLEAIDTRDFAASPNPAQCSWFESLTQFPRIRLLNDDGTNTRVIGNLARLIGNTNNSQDRLQALAARKGSRAEALWGPGVVITDQMIADAIG